MRLQQLLREISPVSTDDVPDVEITGLTADSRGVAPGGLFVAIRGTQRDGHEFLGEAARAGAAALVGDRPDSGWGVPYLQVPDARLAFALLAAVWNGHPTRQLTMIGITGTDGKTTTANLLHAILHHAGHHVGMISTVNALIGSETVDTGLHVTTPDPLDLQRYLRSMVDQGLTHCVLEATSHGLAQHRVAGCAFDLGVITNITHEHLDFHGSFSAYRQAKGRLFSSLGEERSKPAGPEPTAILNRDDDSYEYLRGLTRVRQISYGKQSDSDVRATDLTAGPEGNLLTIEWGGRRQPINSSLLGDYNAANILAAFAAAVEGLGVPPEAAAEAIASFAGVPGRMESIELGQPFAALVDFAHTPNALRQALRAARALIQGRLIAVFGSAGLRDREKRRMMAEASLELADRTILTAEDPRTEPLDDILQDMAAGARNRGGIEGESFWRVPDRGQAVRLAVEMARPGDLVIVCGKGHEQSMCFGEVEHPWDDRVALRAALAEHLGIDGPPMPELPTSV